MPKGITSLEGFIRKLGKIHDESPGVQLLFRGHSDISYEKQPSVFRSANHKKSEHLMIRQLISQQPREFSEDRGIFDYLVRAQHYGLPTRLLDVSLNPLVGLYFAVCAKPNSRAQVIVFKPEVGKQKYYDSDSVTCICTLALLTYGEVQSIVKRIGPRAQEFFLPEDKIKDETVEEFNSFPEVQKLIQLVRQEKPDFRPILQPIDIVRPIYVTPKKLHARILAQNGAFIAFGLAEKPTQKNMNHIDFEVIDIAPENKGRIEKELGQVGISKSTLFPEIENAATAISKRYS